MKRILLLVLSVATLQALGAGCTKQEAFVPPTATTIVAPPVEANALQMWKDYKADPVAAASKYEGKDLHFARVTVDRMSYLGEGMDQELYVQEGIDPNIEQVKFRTDLVSDIINTRESYVVEMVARVTGIQFGYLNLKMSWLRVVDPPGGDTKPPPEY
jgi:hypothetical protein